MQDLLRHTRQLAVLYIEDHIETNVQTTSLLKKNFKKVISSTHYTEAKKHFSDDIDILVTDISLPEKNGIEIAQEFKESNPKLKIIMISAYNDTEFLLKAINVGVDGFLFKPFLLEDLLKILKKVIKLIIMEKENEELKNNLLKLVEEKNKELLKDNITGAGNLAKLNMDIQKKEYFVSLIDINRFKTINSAFGFEFGNKVLKRTAEVLKTLNENIYRIGSDQFVLLCDNENSFEKIRNALDDFKMDFYDFPVFITFTIIGFFSKNDEIINNITKATDYIKEHSLKNSILFLDEEKLNKITQKNQKMAFILNMIKKEKVEPFFQPIVNLHDVKTVKYEVLARIIDNGKTYSPFEFIEDIKKAGLIGEVTKQIISKSIHLAKEVNLSINITDLDLNSEEFVEWLKEQVKIYKISPENITLEILEDISLFNDTNLKNIKKLKNEGFEIAIDDFGTGFSNFERMLNISPDFIKIDGKFIKNIHKDSNARKIVIAMSIMAHSIGAKVIAEYVENDEIIKTLHETGIEYAQGYYFSPPKRTLNDAN